MALMLSVGVLVVLVCSSVRAQQVLPPESLPEEKFYIYSGRAWDKIATLSQSQVLALVPTLMHSHTT